MTPLFLMLTLDDGAFAPVLQRGLQHLAKPWNRRRAMEVFRDESSLAVSPGLWRSIRAALDASRWFILLASPEAARSHWVGEEIKYWVSNKGADHLLVVVTDGTWTWDTGKGDLSPASTAANPALRGVFPAEPKYLDMTWARRDARPYSAQCRLPGPDRHAGGGHPAMSPRKKLRARMSGRSGGLTGLSGR